jgi:preprotein translocase subunit Sec63
LVPATYYYIIRPLCFGEVAIDKSDFQNCQCDKCKKRLKERKSVHRWNFLTQGFIVKLFILAFGWLLLFKCWILVKDLEPLEGFNPHKLLGIEKSAGIKEVKRAYRKLSKTMHPDKNPGNE